MSIQYVGARYVPSFFVNPTDGSDNWKSGIEYEPLTIVYDTTSYYISKIPVPSTVGRPSNNPYYWINAGLYSRLNAEQYIAAWLNSHPEATTTVQDHSLDYKKLIVGTLNFVTPEMYGAKGDGLTDDTQAWQQAVDSGLNVIANNTTYRCGTIYITKDIIIDCNNASFIATSNYLFYASGSVESSIIGQPYNGVKYELPDNYTGMCHIKSTDNMPTTRTYYRAGYVTTALKGVVQDIVPVSFSNVTIDYIKPITIDIKNISNVSFTDSSGYCYAIYLQNGINCKVSKINISGKLYSAITFINCINCIVDNCYIIIDYDGTAPQYYAIEFLDSTKCKVCNSFIVSEYWHCITTGGNYFVLNTIIDNCTLLTTSGVAYSDHDNAINTTITNSIITSIGITNSGKIENCVILVNLVSRDTPTNRCSIVLAPSSLSLPYEFNIKDVNFNAGDLSYSVNAHLGINISTSAQTTNNDYNVSKIVIDNVNTNRAVASFPFSFTPSSTYARSVTFHDIIINNCGFRILFSSSLVSEAYNMKLTNFTGIIGSGSTNDLANLLIYNSTVTLSGSFNNVELHDVKAIGSSLGTFSGETLIAYNIERIIDSVINAFNVVNILNMRESINVIDALLVKNTAITTLTRFRYDVNSGIVVSAVS